MVLELRHHRTGAGLPALVVAECGINHNGDLNLALRMIEAAAGAGADGIKFQLFRAAGMYTPLAGNYRTATGGYVPIYKLMEDVELPLDWIPPLSRACHDHGLEFIMTVCDEWCVEIMDQFNFDVYKIASYEIAHLPMLEAIAKRDKAIFVSTGAATMDEVSEAVKTLSPDDQRPLGLFQCTAKYPAPEEALDLAVIRTFADAFPQITPGFSDHSLDPVKAPVQAIYHGAKVIEKHFTLDRNLPGVDQSFAAEPQHLRELIREVREAEARVANGEPVTVDPVLAGRSGKVVEEDEQVLRGFATRGVFSTRTIRAGEPFTRENLRVLRPGELRQGLHPREYAGLVSGGVAAHDIPQWMGLQPEDVRQ